MENKQKLYSIALASATLVLVFLILISSVASASQVTRIGSGSDPAIYGSKVVWTNGGVIHVYDLTAKTDTTVSSSAASYPAIYGNKLVWHDENSGVPKLTVYDIPSGTRSYIAKDIDSNSIPAIYGNRIVWSANSNIYMRDISTSTQAWIASGGEPDIHDTKIVYSYDDGDMPRIYVYDVITKETITASPHSGHLSQPHIYGNKVIWSDFYTRMGYISMYDIATSKTIDVTSDNTYSGDPNNPDAGDDTGTHTDINGDKVVYAKSGTDQFGSAGVYVYRISTGQSTQVANYENGVLTTPDVYGSTIVWGIGGDSGGVNDNGIYMSDLSAINTLPPLVAFTANVTSGAAPLVVRFTDTSTGGVPTAWLWDFGDGIDSKHATNATHTFTKPGTYNVTLTVTNATGNNSVTKPGYITVTSVTPVVKPVADFYSPEVEQARSTGEGVSSSTAISFIDNSTGSPTSWLWNFGDGSTSTIQNPTHTYAGDGGYIVDLTATNVAGSDTISKYGYVLAGISGPASATSFSSNVTSGNAPLTVLFHDDGEEGIISRLWSFGDNTSLYNQVEGNEENATLYATHTYEKSGKYTVMLKVSGRADRGIITKYNYIEVTDNLAPVAEFTSNVTSGAAPLSVLFNDTSVGSPTSWKWNFGDGIESSTRNATHTFTKPGTYTVSLTVSNEKFTASKTSTITVTQESSSSSSSSGGGAGGSPEPAKNVEVKELSQTFITNGKPVKFDFTRNATCVVYVGFDAKKTAGKTIAIAEQLKGKSTLVSELNAGEVYKYFNVWVGTGGFATSKNIENPVVCFKVEKPWIQENNIDPSSIVLYKYEEEKKEWVKLPVNLANEEDQFLHFTAKVPGYSSFVITGTKSERNTTATENAQTVISSNESDNASNIASNEAEENLKSPGFGIISGVVCLLCIFLSRIKER